MSPVGKRRDKSTHRAASPAREALELNLEASLAAEDPDFEAAEMAES